jgi:hypothetical protein
MAETCTRCGEVRSHPDHHITNAVAFHLFVPSAPSPRDEGRGLDALAAALPVNEEADRRVDALFARQPLGPARTSVAARDEGRAREALREIDALASELEVQAHNEGVECERGGPHEATPKAARKALLDAVARALSPSLGTEGR